MLGLCIVSSCSIGSHNGQCSRRPASAATRPTAAAAQGSRCTFGGTILVFAASASSTATGLHVAAAGSRGWSTHPHTHPQAARTLTLPYCAGFQHDVARKLVVTRLSGFPFSGGADGGNGYGYGSKDHSGAASAYDVTADGTPPRSEVRRHGKSETKRTGCQSCPSDGQRVRCLRRWQAAAQRGDILGFMGNLTMLQQYDYKLRHAAAQRAAAALKQTA